VIALAFESGAEAEEDFVVPLDDKVVCFLQGALVSSKALADLRDVVEPALPFAVQVAVYLRGWGPCGGPLRGRRQRRWRGRRRAALGPPLARAQRGVG
jgi:hypothetical protein